VVEHSLGKGEVESSILSCSTISPNKYVPLLIHFDNVHIGLLLTPLRAAHTPAFHFLRCILRDQRGGTRPRQVQILIGPFMTCGGRSRRSCADRNARSSCGDNAQSSQRHGERGGCDLQPLPLLARNVEGVSKVRVVHHQSCGSAALAEPAASIMERHLSQVDGNLRRKFVLSAEGYVTERMPNPIMSALRSVAAVCNRHSYRAAMRPTLARRCVLMSD
jgi:hypothetical protein